MYPCQCLGQRPFVVGYRISLEENLPAGVRVDEALTLVDRLVQAGIDYLHVSLYDLLNAKLCDASANNVRLLVTRALECVA